MNARTAFNVAASVSLAILAQASFAASASHLITQDQIDAVHTGESATEVSQRLGSPENVTRWMSGEHSMVYELSRNTGDKELVYVDLDKDNKVTDVQLVDR